MLRLYFDEDVDVLAATLLSVRGFDCLTTLAVNALSESDDEQLARATSDQRIIITHNHVDFAQLAVRYWQQSRDHAGIVLAVQRHDVYDLARRLVDVLKCYDQVGWRNVVMYA